jgi:hypothetical protein
MKRSQQPSSQSKRKKKNTSESMKKGNPGSWDRNTICEVSPIAGIFAHKHAQQIGEEIFGLLWGS